MFIVADWLLSVRNDGQVALTRGKRRNRRNLETTEDGTDNIDTACTLQAGCLHAIRGVTCQEGAFFVI